MPLVLEVMYALWIAVCDAFYWALLSIVPYRFLPKYDVKGQVALVTGGGNGLGRLLAIRLAREGVGAVVIWDLDKAGMEETCRLVEKVQGGKAIAYQCDVGDPLCVTQTAARVKDEVGTVTILINNAGIAAGKPLLDLSQQAIKAVFAVNALAHYWTVRAFLPDMLDGHRGHILAISSSAGLHGLPRGTEYSGAKFAVIGFMESLKLELMEKGSTGVTTTTVCPNFSDTGMFTCKWDGLIPLQDPQDVADMALDALLTGKERVTVPWAFGPGVAIMRLLCGLKGQMALGTLMLGKQTQETLKISRPLITKINNNNNNESLCL